MWAIRLIETGDIKQVAAFELEISIISFGGGAVTDIGHYNKKIEKAMKKNPDGMFVLTQNGRVCGWLWMDMNINFTTGDEYANFRSFYISENLRGSGAAEYLLEYGLDWCRKRGAVKVVGKVHSGNMQMRALYKQLGFTATHISMEIDLP